LCNSAFIAGAYWHRVILMWNALPDTVVTAKGRLHSRNGYVTLTFCECTVIL